MAFTTIVGLVTLVPLLFSLLIRLSLALTGKSLTSRSQDRRDVLRALFKRDVDLSSSVNLTEVDNGWEKVGTRPHARKQGEWSGIVGFFHPFW